MVKGPLKAWTRLDDVTARHEARLVHSFCFLALIESATIVWFLFKSSLNAVELVEIKVL